MTLRLLLAALLVADSFLPWYRITWVTTHLDSGMSVPESATGTVWQTSTWWSAAVVVAVAAGLAGVRYRRWASVVGWVAVVLAVGTWALIPFNGGDPGSLAFEPVSPDGPRLGDVPRDGLTGWSQVGWAFYPGVILMVALACPWGRRVGGWGTTRT